MMIRRVLLPVDFSETSIPCMLVALKLAESLRARLDLLHVRAPDAEEEPGFLKWTREALGRCAGQVRRATELRLNCRRGTLCKEILAYAEAENIDLILLPRFRNGATLGDEIATATLMAGAPCAVMAISPEWIALHARLDVRAEPYWTSSRESDTWRGLRRELEW